MQTQVLIVGAGPTGLAAAVALLRSGIRVRVVDAAAGPATTSRALGLLPRGVEVLARLGALGDLPMRSLGSSRATIREGGQVVFSWNFASGPDDRVLFITQAEIEARLRDRLEELGGGIAWNSPLTAASQDAAGVSATVGGNELRADWLIGCDGAHSVVRKLAGIGFPGVPVVERVLLTDVRADLPFDREGTSTWLHPTGTVIVIPLPDGTWRLFTQPPAGMPDDVDSEEIAASALADVTARTGVTVDAEILWCSQFRIHRRLAESYRSGRLFLAGDAAHIHSPIGAQGMNTGLGDAENLAWKLALVAKSVAGDRLLDTYEAERRPLAQAVLGRTTSVTSLLLAPTLTRQLVRNFVLRPVLRLSAVQRRLWRMTSQLDVSYRNGPLGGGPSASRGPRPGDRVPVQALDGLWTVLAADQDQAVICAESVRDLFGDMAIAARVADVPDVRLVRPDGHLAWRGSSLERLRARLSAMLAS